MIKQPLIRAMIVAGFSVGMMISATTNAEPLYTQPNMPAIVGYDFTPDAVDGFPSNMLDWIQAPNAYSWNPVNARQGNHPDRGDGGVVYIFTNKADADAWWDGITGEPPAGVPDKAVAYVHWALDNESGTFPGIMAMTDDFNFKFNNCIMSSGPVILSSENQLIRKTCDNDAGTSKRFKLVILQADLPIDIIFNMTNKDLDYQYYTASSVPPIMDDIFRNYRYLMKVGNGTGTDTLNEDRPGKRISGIKVELGFSDLATGDFTKSTNNEDDGLAYEIRQCVDKRYFDTDALHPIGSTDYCLAETRELFLPHEFATFSPGMFAIVGDERNPGGGYWDVNPAGLALPSNPPGVLVPTSSLIQPQFIESYDVTDNYFDVAGNQANGSSVSGNVFGYLMPYGVFANGDPGAIPMGIYKDDDGDPATEGSLYAWWDGISNYRWGIDGSNSDDDGAIGPDAWGLVSEAELAEMMAHPLSETEVLEPPRYEVGYMDDLGGLNVDTYIKITPDFIVKPYPELGSTFTVRLTAKSVEAGVPGTADGPWVANPADATAFEPDPADTATTTTSSDGGSSGFSLSWITAGLLALGLLLRRRRF